MDWDLKEYPSEFEESSLFSMAVITLSISNNEIAISCGDEKLLQGLSQILEDYFKFSGVTPNLVRIKLTDSNRQIPQAKAAISNYLKRKGILASVEHTGNGSWTFVLKDVITANRKYQPKELRIVSNNSKEQLQASINKLNRMAAYTSEKELLEQELSQRAKESYG